MQLLWLCYMDNLPLDIVLDIFSRLPITSLFQIKCVCKNWYAIAQDFCLLEMHHARVALNDPCFLLHCRNPNEDKLYFLDGCQSYSKKARRFQSPFLSENAKFEVVGSCDGLVCTFDWPYGDPMHVFNPLTGEYLKLPKAMEYQHQKVAFGFGVDPRTREYKVVRVAYHETHIFRNSRGWTECSDVQILTLGTEAWRSLGSAPCRLECGPAEAVLNGALHWVTRRYNRRAYAHYLHIVSFDLANEEFKIIQRPDGGDFDYHNFHLVILFGCLSMVVETVIGQIEIYVMKEYGVKESWSKDLVIKGSHLSINPIDKDHLNKTRGIQMQVVCNLKDKALLVEYDGTLLVYNRESGEFNDILIQGLPKWFSSTTKYYPSLLPIEATLGSKASKA